MAIMTDATGQAVAAAIRERADLAPRVMALENQAVGLRSDLDAERGKVQPVSLGGTGATSAAGAAASLYVEYLGAAGSTIQEGADLNSYTTPGVYRCDGNSTATSLANRPPDLLRSFRLVVYQTRNSGFAIQELTDYDTGIRWRRARISDGTWRSWALVDGVDSIVAEGTSGNWSYIKWANGKCELEYTYAKSGFNFTQWGSLYECQLISAVSYPFALTSVPVVTATITDLAAAFEISVPYSDRLTKSPTVYALRATSFSDSNSRIVKVHFSGTWK